MDIITEEYCTLYYKLAVALVNSITIPNNPTEMYVNIKIMDQNSFYYLNPKPTLDYYANNYTNCNKIFIGSPKKIIYEKSEMYTMQNCLLVCLHLNLYSFQIVTDQGFLCWEYEYIYNSSLHDFNLYKLVILHLSTYCWSKRSECAPLCVAAERRVQYFLVEKRMFF